MKLVPESLNEVNFERGRDPKAAMGVGISSILSDPNTDSREKLHKFLEIADEDTGGPAPYIKILDDLLYDYNPQSNDFNSVFREHTIFKWILNNGPEILHKHQNFAKPYLQYVRPYDLDTDTKKANYYDLMFEIFTLQKSWSIFVDNHDILGMKLADDKGANIASGKIKPYIVAIDGKDLDMLERLLKKGADPSASFPRQGQTEYNYPIRRASFHGWAEGVERLLRDHRVNPADHNNSALSGAEKGLRGKGNTGGNYEETVRLLLNDREVWRAIHAGRVSKALLKRMGIKP